MGTYKCTGTVILIETSDGVSGATVTARNLQTNALVTTALSGTAGSFSLECVAQDLDFSASKSGVRDDDLAVINVDIQGSSGSTNM
jgi:hypothetical protein